MGRSEPQREPDVQEDALFQSADGEHVAGRATSFDTLSPPSVSTPSIR